MPAALYPFSEVQGSTSLLHSPESGEGLLSLKKRKTNLFQGSMNQKKGNRTSPYFGERKKYSTVGIIKGKIKKRNKEGK